MEKLDEQDRELIKSAAQILERVHNAPLQTVGCALLTSSGNIYCGVNIEGHTGFGACAETITIGTAITANDAGIERIVALTDKNAPHRLLPPCGNCRQLLLDYAPECWVILKNDGVEGKVRASEFLPYRHWRE